MSIKKGIILAAGKGSRLYPLTTVVNKQLLPVFDKPMIFYPLSLLMQLGIQDILLITNPASMAQFQALLGDGTQFGIRLSYAQQIEQKGIADALLIGESFVGNDRFALILGDNFFFGSELIKTLKDAAANENGAAIFCYTVSDPRSYGIACIEQDGNVTDLAEKPESPVSDQAVTGLYFYDPSACALARTLVPSARNEIEITDLNKKYLNESKLRAIPLDSSMTWMDLGTPEKILLAGNFIRAIQQDKGQPLGCPFETARQMGFI